MKVKIFQHTEDLEYDINEFLEDNPNIIVDRMLQSESGVFRSPVDGGQYINVTITIVYSETHEWDVQHQMKKEK